MGWFSKKAAPVEPSEATSGAAAAAAAGPGASPQQAAAAQLQQQSPPTSSPAHPQPSQQQQPAPQRHHQQQHQQQKQPPRPPNADPAGCPGGDCVFSLVHQKSYCKPEYAAFESCFDDAEAGKKREDDCMPLVSAYYACSLGEGGGAVAAV